MFEQTSPYVVSLTAVEAIREAIPHLFTVTDTTLDWPEKGHFRFRGQFVQEADACFDELRAAFEGPGIYADDPGGRRPFSPSLVCPHLFNPAPSSWHINLILLLATILSTMFMGRRL
ncbi:MAG: hypothetical protein M5U34_48820 [Chloroflexi bacterium]|nr:hypothetical protein [Chloroflexota bacterium]